MATLADRFAAIALLNDTAPEYRRASKSWQRALREVARPVKRELTGGITDTLTFSDGSILTLWRVVDSRGPRWVRQ